MARLWRARLAPIILRAMDLRLGLMLVIAAEVCGDPAQPCAGFRDNDLSFARESTGTARAEEVSAAFFAVILESAERCTIPEAERRRVQALFPARKVFSSRFECDGDPENNVRYTEVEEKRAFVAVYAGATRADGEKLLEEAKAKGFTGASVRRMQVMLVHP
jgi:hypothetical protein